jgi:hypothetical protein
MRMHRLRICQRLSAVSLLLASPVWADCTALTAHYQMAEDPAGAIAQLRFAPATAPSAFSDLDLVLTASDLAAPERLALTASNGYGATYAIPLGPILSGDSLPIAVFADVDGRLSPYPGTLPQSASPPPDAIFVTDLGQSLFYGTAVTTAQVYVPSGMWYLAGCD